jgi:hypothetical protein
VQSFNGKYSIFVKGIIEGKVEEFLDFVVENIYMECALNGEELPSIMPIQIKEKPTWTQEIEYKPICAHIPFIIQRPQRRDQAVFDGLTVQKWSFEITSEITHESNLYVTTEDYTDQLAA